MTLKDSTGLWLSGDMLITHIRDAFTKIFTSTSPQTRTLLPWVRYYLQYNPFIEHHQWHSSTPLPLLPEEIYRNVFSTLL